MMTIVIDQEGNEIQKELEGAIARELRLMNFTKRVS